MMVFSSNRTGSMDVLFRDLTSGEERTITSEAPGKSKDGALIDVKGNNVVYTMSDSFNGEIYVTSAHGGAKRRICGDCGRASSLSPDGEQILTYRQHAPINLVNVTSGKSTPLLHHVKYALSAARFSPDGKWISFLMAKGTGAVDAMLVPFRGESVIPERDWITITTAPANISQVFWSPDGGLIYYVLNLASSS